VLGVRFLWYFTVMHHFLVTFCLPRETLKYDARRNAVIRGLLYTRQTDFCPPGLVTCSVSQQTCCSTTTGESCCSDGSCCDSTTYCVLGTNGIVGCCPNGQVCSGPSPNQTTTTFDGPSPSSDTATGPVIQTTIIQLPPPTVVTVTSVELTSEFTDLTTTVTTTVFVLMTSTSPSTTLVRATAESSGPKTTTSTNGLLSAVGRAQPYRPLLVFHGILVAMIYWA